MEKFGCEIRDGKKSDPGSGINIPDPQHWNPGFDAHPVGTDAVLAGGVCSYMDCTRYREGESLWWLAVRLLKADTPFFDPRR
jgi:hypothetical protein